MSLFKLAYWDAGLRLGILTVDGILKFDPCSDSHMYPKMLKGNSIDPS